MKYKSKIDWWFHIIAAVFILTNIWSLIMFFSNGGIERVDRFSFGVTAFLFLLCNAFIIPLWLNTYYVIKDDELYIKCGYMKPKTIPYNTIKSINESRSPLASAGLSLDRIEIKYNKHDIILISPVNKQEFIELLNDKIKA